MQALLVALAATPSVAMVDVPGGPTLDGLHRLSEQAGFDFTVAAKLDGRSSPRVRGRLAPEVALERLLAPAGLRAVRIAEHLYRIEPARSSAQAALAPSPLPPPVEPVEIVVTGSVRRGALAGTQGLNRLSTNGLARAQTSLAAEAISDLSATVESTRLGPGRNKLFIRGIADSGFSGPLQATVGQYFGDLRLTFGSPDPDLAAIDLERVDVFEGPQGTRFGSGPIGGVIRFQPRLPKMRSQEGLLLAGAGATVSGGGSGDVALVANIPSGTDTAARVVAYGQTVGGFADADLVADGADRVNIAGGRVAFRSIVSGWTVDASVIAQRIMADDVQRAYFPGFETLPLPPSVFQTSRSRQKEPYSSDFALIGLTASRRLGKTHYTYAVSVSGQRVSERFDATGEGPNPVTLVDRKHESIAISGEARIEHRFSDAWIYNGGVAVATGNTRLDNIRNTPTNPGAVAGLSSQRRFKEVAIFGELAANITSRWRVSYGTRYSASSIRSRMLPFELIRPIEGSKARTEISALSRNAAPEGQETPSDPRRQAGTREWTQAVSTRFAWSANLSLFARLEEGGRPAGITDANLGFNYYLADRLRWREIGIEYQWGSANHLEISTGHVDWRNIQADTIAVVGDIHTDNVGDGVIDFVQLKARLRLSDNLALSGSVLFNESRLTATKLSIVAPGPGPIPNVAPMSSQLSVDWQLGTIFAQPFSVAADLRYVGKSVLGVGPGFEIPQGGYVKTDLSFRYGEAKRTAFLQVSNPLNVSGTRYAIGSPYQLYRGQYSPVRPLTLRLGVEIALY